MTMCLSDRQDLGGFQLISLCNTKVFWQCFINTTWVVVFYLIHLLNFVISTLIELDSHHGLWIFLAVRHAMVSVFFSRYKATTWWNSLPSPLFEDVTNFHENLWTHLLDLTWFILILVVNFVDFNCFCVCHVYIFCVLHVCIYFLYVCVCVYLCVLQYRRTALPSAVS